MIFSRLMKCRHQKQVHELCLRVIVLECHDSTIAIPVDMKSGFLQHLSPHTVLGALPLLKLAADANPFPVVLVVLLADPVQHQHLLILHNIDKGRFSHCSLQSLHSEAISVRIRSGHRYDFSFTCHVKFMEFRN